MTQQQQTEVQRRARQDASALKSGWPSRGCPYNTEAEIDLYEEVYQAALKEGRK
jgi:hypothetical protein